MNKLIIIGNGFDLAHGLKTKYSDFLVWYLNQTLNCLCRGYEFEDELIKIEKPNYVFQAMEIESLKQYRQYLKEAPFIKLRYKSDFFKELLLNAEEKQWVDIESEYYRCLIKYYVEAEKNDFSYWSTEFRSIQNFHRSFNFIKAKLFEYIGLLKADIYNSTIANRIEEIIYEQDLELTKEKIDDSILIMNFNYSSTLQAYKHELKSLKLPIINIHGSIGQGLESIIFGYGDEMDPYYQKIENLNSNELLKNIKSFGYLKNSNYQKFRSFTDKEKFNVFILGHSCGLSDRILLNSIFVHDNCESIRIYYHKRSETDNDYTEKTMEISRHFGPQNKDKMRRRIVPFDKCVPLT